MIERADVKMITPENAGLDCVPKISSGDDVEFGQSKPFARNVWFKKARSGHNSTDSLSTFFPVGELFL
jgi:hypothetical protein